MTDGCDYCYGTMSRCPVCDGADYAESMTIGGQKDAGYHVDGWAFSGRGLDWAENANARGWCWRDTEALLKTLYEPASKLAELAFRPSGLAIALGAK